MTKWIASSLLAIAQGGTQQRGSVPYDFSTPIFSYKIKPKKKLSKK
jgi:hypothetical protein